MLSALCRSHLRKKKEWGWPSGRAFKTKELRGHDDAARVFIAQNRDHKGVRAGVDWWRRRLERAVEAATYITSSTKPWDVVTHKLAFLSEAGVPPKELLARCIAVWCFAETLSNCEHETSSRNAASHVLHALPLGCRSAHRKARALLGTEIYDALLPLFVRISQYYRDRHDSTYAFHQAVEQPFAGE